jgi:hypothetical protein
VREDSGRYARDFFFTTAHWEPSVMKKRVLVEKVMFQRFPGFIKNPGVVMVIVFN